MSMFTPTSTGQFFAGIGLWSTLWSFTLDGLIKVSLPPSLGDRTALTVDGQLSNGAVVDPFLCADEAVQIIGITAIGCTVSLYHACNLSAFIPLLRAISTLKTCT